MLERCLTHAKKYQTQRKENYGQKIIGHEQDNEVCRKQKSKYIHICGIMCV